MASLKEKIVKVAAVFGIVTGLTACGTSHDSTSPSPVIDEKCAKVVDTNPSVSFSECQKVVETAEQIGKIASGNFFTTDPNMNVAKAMRCAQNAYELYDREGTSFELDQRVVQRYAGCLNQ